MPYHIQETLFDDLSDNQKEIISYDQRNDWWKKYGKLKGKDYTRIPDDLVLERLEEITAQPLLNYLVALSLERGKIKFTYNTNLNDIYRDLLEGVYERAYEKRQNTSLKVLELNDFCRILEEIAISAWHGGDTRTTSVKQIEEHIKRNNLIPLLDRFKTDAKAGIIRLLTAFYFREFGIQGGEQTFEFTHKSFGEYLISVRLVKQIKRIEYQLNERKKNYDLGWNEEQALEAWLEIAGETAIDRYLFKFILDEVANFSKNKLIIWQKTLARLLSVVINNGMPMGKERRSHKEETKTVRNSGEALLVLLHACVEQTKELAEIELHSATAFGSWFSSLQPQRGNGNNAIAFRCLTYLKLSNSCFDMQDMYSTNLSYSDLSNCTFYGAIFGIANLQGANLQGANLQGANLQNANLKDANLQDANLQNANLEDANLYVANLQRAKMQRANLKDARLDGVDLQGAKLQNADLQRLDLGGANLGGANLEGANLEGANLQNANLQGINLTRAKVDAVNLQNSNLTKARLRNSSLQSVKLQGAILNEADLREANLLLTDFKGINLHGTKLRGAIVSLDMQHYLKSHGIEI